MTTVKTHDRINKSLCGNPVETGPGRAKLELTAIESMIVDSLGLVHGGFIFGLADHAAMVAVNHPNVVLAGADVKFLKPVVPGENLVADALVTEDTGKRQTVTVTVKRDDDIIFQGIFACAVPERHVLEPRK